MTTVMLVDDHLLVRVAIATLLEATPDLTVVAVATNGYEAVQLAESVRPDVVLMDMSMPQLDGVAATGRIMELLPMTRIVLLTSSQDRRRIRKALTLGAVAHLEKGCSSEVLLAAVREAAGRVVV
jgi:DNA-binding NarL/FixJ family response regulator